jgi:TRAP-type mannitol/chloroaromatic compound transport system permease large subunit
MVSVYIWALFDKTIGRPISKEERIRGIALLKLVSINLLPPIFLIFAVMGSIFFGLVGPSEAGAMGVLGAAVLVAINGRFNLETFKKSTTTAVKICTAVLFICLGGQVFIGVFIMMGGDVALKTIILGFHFGPFGTLLVMLTIVWILGFVMDWIALIFILTPIYTSLLTFLGIDPLYFGILFCSTLAISNMTPPFAYSAFYLRTIAPKSITMAQIYKGCIPFFWVNTAMVAVILYEPWFVMWLPRIAYK